MKICTTSVPRKKMYKSSANSTRVKIDPTYTKSYLQTQTVWFWTRNLGPLFQKRSEHTSKKQMIHNQGMRR
jgi:hypothetical protein